MLFRGLFKESEMQLSSWQILISNYSIVMGMNKTILQRNWAEIKGRCWNRGLRQGLMWACGHGAGIPDISILNHKVSVRTLGSSSCSSSISRMYRCPVEL